MGNTETKPLSNNNSDNGLATLVLSPDDEYVEITDKFLVVFPQELQQLVKLKSINLTRNRVGKLQGISGIVNLKELDVSYNSLTSIQDELCKCLLLESLNLSFNQINTFTPFISQLKNLKIINLSNNLIPSIPSDIGFCSNLTIINLSFNKLKDLPKEIGKLNNLNKLILNNNQIQSLPNEIGGLVKLNLLDLAENELRTLPSQISKLKSLVKLYLDNNDFLELISEMGELTGLKELNLRSNQLVDLPSSMHKLVNLTILDLDDNQWEGIEYTVNDIKRLLGHLKVKKDIVNKSRKSTSKEYRRTIQRQKVEEKKRLSINNTVFEQPFQIVESKKKLYHIKANMNDSYVIVDRVAPTGSSLNSNDVFLLDTGKKLYMLVGRNANQRERLKGLHLMKLFSQDTDGQSEILTIDLNKSKKEDIAEFWKDLGGKVTNITGGIEVDLDENDVYQSRVLYKFMETDGRLDIQLSFEMISKSQLDPNCCVVLDTGCDVYVWIGLYCSENEKNWALLKAEEVHSYRPDYSELIWVMEGHETFLFKEYFYDWVDNSWDPNFKLIQDQIENQNREAEEQRLKMEKEEEEEAARMNRRSYDSNNNSITSSNSNISLSSAISSNNSTPNIISPIVPITNSTVIPSVVNSSGGISLPPIKPSTTLSSANSSTYSSPIVLPQLPSQGPSNLPVYNNNSSGNATSPLLSERDKIKEREKEKIKEKLKQRESSSNKLPTINNNNIVSPQTTTLPSIPKSTNTTSTTVTSLPPIKPINSTSSSANTTPSIPSTPTTPVINKLPEPVKKVEPTPQPISTPVSTKPIIVETKQPEPVKKVESTPISKVSTTLSTPNSANITPTTSTPVVSSSVTKQPEPIPVAITTSTNDDTQFLTPLPEKTEGNKRKPATKNPIRARQERAAVEEEAAKKRLEEKSLNVNNNNNNNNTINSNQNNNNNNTNKSNTAAALGGFGLLYALGANENLFKKKSEINSQQTNNLGDPFTINIQPKDQPKLLHIKGRRSPFVRQVELSVNSLNKGDVFILDCGKEKNLLYQWNGSEANRIEKGKGMDISKSIKDKERVGCRVIIVDEGKEPDDFWKVLGVKLEDKDRVQIASADSAGDDREAELSIRQYINLYRVVPINQDKELDLVPIQGRLSKTLLESEECYILDCVSEMFAWTGTNSKLKVRNMTLKLAADMFSQRSCWTSGNCHREFPGSEQVLFKERFPDWGGSIPIQVQQAASGQNTASSKKQEKINISTMHKPRIDREEVMIDDGSGKLQIWRVEEFQKVALDPKQFGQFYSGDSYLVLYTYFFKNKDNYLIYFWQGKNSSINEKGTSALLTVELDDSLKGMAKEVRVTQNKEPKHFLTIFKSKFIIHLGKDPLSKNYKPPANPKDPKIYHIRGTHDFNTRAIESKLSIHTLNSYNSFVINNIPMNNSIYIWFGKFSNDIEKTFAKTISTHVSQSTPGSKVIEIQEGKETDEFIKLFPSSSLLTPKIDWPFKNSQARIEPRLYLCTVGSGVYSVEEVNNFAQEDLIQEDVFIVDGINQIWVWIGTDTAEIERRMSMEVAIEYSSTLEQQQNRIPNIPVYVTYHSKEPFIFTSLFHGWDFSKRPSSIALTFDHKDTILAKDILDLYTKKYTFDELINKRYPRGIDGSRLEEYLSDEEFFKIFQMNLQQFQQLPLWKKQSLKKELRLY